MKTKTNKTKANEYLRTLMFCADGSGFRKIGFVMQSPLILKLKNNKRIYATKGNDEIIIAATFVVDLEGVATTKLYTYFNFLLKTLQNEIKEKEKATLKRYKADYIVIKKEVELIFNMKTKLKGTVHAFEVVYLAYKN